jgi:hypothetical protein
MISPFELLPWPALGSAHSCGMRCGRAILTLPIRVVLHVRRLGTFRVARVDAAALIAAALRISLSLGHFGRRLSTPFPSQAAQRRRRLRLPSASALSKGVGREDGQQSRQAQDKRTQEKVLPRQAKPRKNRWPEACACEGSGPRQQLRVDLRKIWPWPVLSAIWGALPE